MLWQRKIYLQDCATAGCIYVYLHKNGKCFLWHMNYYFHSWVCHIHNIYVLVAIGLRAWKKGEMCIDILGLHT